MFSIKPLALVAFLAVATMSDGVPLKDDLVRRQLYYGKGGGKGGKGGGKGGKGGKGGQPNCSKSGKSGVKERYFDVRLEKGESKTIVEDGPIRVFMTCSEDSTNLKINVGWHEDLLVFGDIAEDQGLDGPPLVDQILQAGDILEKNMWTCCEGQDTNDGAVWLSTGHYVGLYGDSTVGIQNSDSAELALAGESHNCVVSGIINYAFPKGKY